jgi:putative ABC transport system substrate-binding protein
MNRKFLFWLLTTVLLTTVSSAQAQQPKKVPRIGFLSGRSAPNPTNPDPSGEAFRRGLRDLGYIQGKISWLTIAMLRERWTVSQAL